VCVCLYLLGGNKKLGCGTLQIASQITTTPTYYCYCFYFCNYTVLFLLEYY
jgi:hypothetical protein